MGLSQGIFDNIGEPAEELNPYLTDATAGLRLVSRIISETANAGSASGHAEVTRLISEDLVRNLSALRVPDEFQFTQRLEALNDRLSVPAKYIQLKNHTVIGVGGQFSSGKSSFLNSLLGETRMRLPEEVTPSTAVPSYIIAGPQEQARAYNVHGNPLELDSDAIAAISHAFQKTHGLGLAQYLSFITITTPALPDGVAFLDTPGYNKADISMVQSYADREKARQELKSIDFLVWLMDVENGTLTAEDIDFIRQTEVSTPVLIVINKCDMKDEEDVMSIVDTVRDTAIRAQLNLYDVVPYSSEQPELYEFAVSIVQQFIWDARDSGLRVENLGQKLNDIAQGILAQSRQNIAELAEMRDMLGDQISSAQDPLAATGIAEEYTRLSRELIRLARSESKVEKTVADVMNALEAL